MNSPITRTLFATVFAAGIAFAGAASAQTAPLRADSPAAQIAGSVPADVMGQSRDRIDSLLRNAAAAETAGDDVFARSWRQHALDEIAAASRASDMVAEAGDRDPR